MIILTALVVPALVPVSGWTQTPSFRGLGTAEPGSPSQAYGVSGDGSVVVGEACTSTQCNAFRWTAATGLVLLGSDTFRAEAASNDGFYAVGQGSGAPDGQLHAFRWNPIEGAAWLSIYSGEDVSEDGSVIVCCAVRWMNGVVTFLPNLGACCTQAHGVSGDGVVVVGGSRSSVYGTERAFRWTEANGIADLGTNGFATTASRDGSVIAGRKVISISESHAFRWTVTGGVEDIGTLGGKSGTAQDMSADGSVIVGNAGINTSSVQRAFRWTTKRKMQDLRQELLNAGVQEVQGWTLQSATGVSADGTVIVGYGIGPSRVTEAFLAVLPLPQ
jgi:probable HAF family extracellular repeat protein